MPRQINLAALNPKRVCLIKPSSLGDIVHALPVLAALRERWPNAHLAWVVNQGLRGLLDGHPMLDEVIPFDRASARWTPSGISGALRFLGKLREKHFDLTIDLQGLFRSGVIAAATCAPIRVGLADAREGATRFYSHRVPMPEKSHAVDRLMTVARALGCSNQPRFVVAMTESDRAWAKAALAVVPHPRLILNIGARWLTKRWPAEHFAEVARRAANELGAGLIAIGAPEDRGRVDTMREVLGDVPLLDLCGRTNLPQLTALVSEADCVLSNDTGPLHLAAATGVPVVGVYTCTMPWSTGPYGPNAEVVQTQVRCAGSCVKTCSRIECMSELTSERVWRVVQSTIEGSAASKQRDLPAIAG